MRVRAALWFDIPCAGATSAIKTYRCMKDVVEEFESMIRICEDYGGAAPVGTIYPLDSDEPIYNLSTGPNFGIVREKL